jgi:uncharacterized protein
MRFLLLPGWLDSGPTHWQSEWERRHGYVRVQQDDWVWPRRGDWMARLQDVLSEGDTPAVLVAHSLGCHLVAAWSEHAHNTGAGTARVVAAMLVAPPDLAREDTPPNLYSWRPVRRARLPFAALVVGSENDPFSGLEQTRALAMDWGAALAVIGNRGHINGDSGLGEWVQGHRQLQALLKPAS